MMLSGHEPQWIHSACVYLWTNKETVLTAVITVFQRVYSSATEHTQTTAGDFVNRHVYIGTLLSAAAKHFDSKEVPKDVQSAVDDAAAVFDDVEKMIKSTSQVVSADEVTSINHRSAQCVQTLKLIIPGQQVFESMHCFLIEHEWLLRTAMSTATIDLIDDQGRKIQADATMNTRWRDVYFNLNGSETVQLQSILADWKAMIAVGAKGRSSEQDVFKMAVESMEQLVGASMSRPQVDFSQISFAGEFRSRPRNERPLFYQVPHTDRVNGAPIELPILYAEDYTIHDSEPVWKGAGGTVWPGRIQIFHKNDRVRRATSALTLEIAVKRMDLITLHSADADEMQRRWESEVFFGTIFNGHPNVRLLIGVTMQPLGLVYAFVNGGPLWNTLFASRDIAHPFSKRERIIAYRRRHPLTITLDPSNDNINSTTISPHSSRSSDSASSASASVHDSPVSSRHASVSTTPPAHSRKSSSLLREHDDVVDDTHDCVPPMNLGTRLCIAQQLIITVAAFHRVGVYSPHLSSLNLLVHLIRDHLPLGIKLGDFGTLCTSPTFVDQNPCVDPPFVPCGRERWRPPASSAATSLEGDFYHLGLILGELFLEEMPYVDYRTDDAVLRAKEQGKPPFSSELINKSFLHHHCPKLTALIRQCIEQYKEIKTIDYLVRRLWPDVLTSIFTCDDEFAKAENLMSVSDTTYPAMIRHLENGIQVWKFDRKGGISSRTFSLVKNGNAPEVRRLQLASAIGKKDLLQLSDYDVESIEDPSMEALPLRMGKKSPIFKFQLRCKQGRIGRSMLQLGHENQPMVLLIVKTLATLTREEHARNTVTIDLKSSRQRQLQDSMLLTRNTLAAIAQHADVLDKKLAEQQHKANQVARAQFERINRDRLVMVSSRRRRQLMGRLAARMCIYFWRFKTELSRRKRQDNFIS